MRSPAARWWPKTKSVIVRVDARRGSALYVNDGAFGTLFDAAYSGFRFPARLVATSRRKQKPLAEFALYGPTCDSVGLSDAGTVPAAE